MNATDIEAIKAAMEKLKSVQGRAEAELTVFQDAALADPNENPYDHNNTMADHLEQILMYLLECEDHLNGIVDDEIPAMMKAEE